MSKHGFKHLLRSLCGTAKGELTELWSECLSWAGWRQNGRLIEGLMSFYVNGVIGTVIGLR